MILQKGGAVFVKKESFQKYLALWGLYGATLVKWAALSLVIGLVSGVLGTIFHIGVEKATQLRGTYPWLLWLLPVAGLLIVAIYRLTGTEGQGTNDIFNQVHQGNRISLWLLPAIFCGTILTHLCGGSAGREGAALQMGGAIGFHTGRLFRLDDRDLRTVTMTGMAAFFSALFGTPVAAALFAVLVVSVGQVYHANYLPSLAAAIVAYGVSLAMGVGPTRFVVEAPALDALLLAKTAVLAMGCGLVSLGFCAAVHSAEHRLKQWLPNPWVRAAAGGAALVALTFLCGTTRYNGAGMDVITAAVEQGKALPMDFVWKILFTALTLGAGFKGGEVVPSFFIGAVFGCVAGPLLGIPAGFAAALGLAAVFCGAANCPIAATVLAVELFGAEGLVYFALCCAVANLFSGYGGLYSSQRILYSKWKARYIHIQANDSVEPPPRS